MAFGFVGRGAGRWKGPQGEEEVQAPCHSDSVPWVCQSRRKGDEPEACQIKLVQRGQLANLWKDICICGPVCVCVFPSLEGSPRAEQVCGLQNQVTYVCPGSTSHQHTGETL